MSFLVGKIIYREPRPTNRYGVLSNPRREFLKIVAKDDFEGETNYIVINLINRRIDWLNKDTLTRECFLCPTIEREDSVVVMHGEYTLYLKDFFLHRVGGPAFISSKEKKYYILGKQVDKEAYFDAMPEDIQTEMAFKINQL